MIETIGGRLRAWRQSRTKTQAEISDLTGIPVDTWKKYEGDIRAPGSEALSLMVKAGLNLNWLMTGEGDMKWGADDTPPPPAVNYELLSSAELAVHRFLDEEGGTAPPERIARLVIALYKYGEAKGLIKKDDLEQFLKLVA